MELREDRLCARQTAVRRRAVAIIILKNMGVMAGGVNLKSQFGADFQISPILSSKEAGEYFFTVLLLEYLVPRVT